MVAALLVGTAGGVLTAMGCHRSPPQPPTVEVASPEPLAKAREAMDRRDYDAAVALLREALVRDPAELEAHYRLGVSASHLDRLDEASQAFEWVVAHGRPGAPEVQIARDWLGSPTIPNAPAPAVSPPAGEAPAPKPGMASLVGRAVGPEGPRPRLQLFLKGLPGSAVKDEYHVLRTDQQGNFGFTDVVPGEYVLTNTIAGPPAWRLRVSLGKDERRVLDLTPANQAAIRDDVPERP